MVPEPRLARRVCAHFRDRKCSRFRESLSILLHLPAAAPRCDGRENQEPGERGATQNAGQEGALGATVIQ